MNCPFCYDKEIIMENSQSSKEIIGLRLCKEAEELCRIS